MTYAATAENTTQRRTLAMGISLLLHAVLILFIVLWKILTPIPPFAEGGGMGMVVDIGFSELGMGDNPDNMEPAPTEQAAAPPTVQEDAVMTEETDEVAVSAPDPKTPRPDKPKKPEPVKVTEPTISKELQRALGAWDQKGGGEGQGNSDQPGNVGRPDGQPGGDGAGTGTGTGTFHGPGWDVNLAGRTIRKRPVIDDKPDKAGKVVLDIFVDSEGKVVRAVWNSGKSTTTDQGLVDIAKRAAMASSFYSKPGAAAEQKGEMTFIFILE